MIRISDHDLNPGNYLPAGVINENYYSISKSVPIRFLRWNIDEYLCMSVKEKEYLWTNRMVIEDPDFPNLTILEPMI